MQRQLNSLQDGVFDTPNNQDQEGKLEINENDGIDGDDESLDREQNHCENPQKGENSADIDEEDSNIIPPEISLFDLKTKRLQHLFNKEFENFERSLTHFKKTSTEMDYRNELIITFWLAVHQSSFEFACFIYNHQDSDFLRKRCSLLARNSFKANQIDEKKIRKVLKESDSFAAENVENNEQINENASTTGANMLTKDQLQIIGGPAAVALKKK